jgi:hypothetical protein
VGNRSRFYWGEPVLLTIVLPGHVSKFDPKNDMAIYLGDPEGQVDSHIVLLSYYHRLITRSGATCVDITSEQFAKFYSVRLRLLQPRRRADTMATLLDFVQFHLEKRKTKRSNCGTSAKARFSDKCHWAPTDRTFTIGWTSTIELWRS